MTPAELTELLLSLDDAQLGTARHVLESRLLAYRHGDLSYPDFERLSQLTVDECYLLLRQIPDTTLAEALKAGSECLRDSVLLGTSRSRRHRVEARMRRIGPIRQSVAETAVDAVLAELARQQASGAICDFLSDDEAKKALDAIRAGLPDKVAASTRIHAEAAEQLSRCLRGASDHALREVIAGADPCDLALLLVQQHSVTPTEQLLRVGKFRYMRELLAAVLALQAGHDAAESGRPGWQIIATVLRGNYDLKLGDGVRRTTTRLSTPSRECRYRPRAAERLTRWTYPRASLIARQRNSVAGRFGLSGFRVDRRSIDNYPECSGGLAPA